MFLAIYIKVFICATFSLKVMTVANVCADN